jgi:hypothetical protein
MLLPHVCANPMGHPMPGGAWHAPPQNAFNRRKRHRQTLSNAVDSDPQPSRYFTVARASRPAQITAPAPGTVLRVAPRCGKVSVRRSLFVRRRATLSLRDTRRSQRSRLLVGLVPLTRYVGIEFRRGGCQGAARLTSR